jgi:ABC-type multidrug transport system fused ATPase/permease subunit
MWIDVSRQGVRIPYLRFLADATPGFLVCGLFLLAVYLPGDGNGIWKKMVESLEPLRGGMGVEVKIFALALLFFLAVPIGLAINGAGWYLLGWTHSFPGVLHSLVARLQRLSPRLFRRPFTTGHVVSSMLSSTGSTLHDLTTHLQQVIEIHAPHLLSDLQHYKGLRRLARSSAMLLLLMIVGVLPNPFGWSWQLLLVFAFLGCVLALLVEYTEAGKTLYKVYAIIGSDEVRHYDQAEIARQLTRKLVALKPRPEVEN